MHERTAGSPAIRCAPDLPAGEVPRTRRPKRHLVYQLLLALGIAALLFALGHNTLENMRLRGIRGGYDFLQARAGFDISEAYTFYGPAAEYWRAYLVGVFNTLKVSAHALVMATLLGLVVGVARVSGNGMLRAVCACFIEVFRNVPLLVQLFLWYLLFTQVLPNADAPYVLFDSIFLSKEGLLFPTLQPASAAGAGLGLASAIVATLLVAAKVRRFAPRRPVSQRWSLAVASGLSVLSLVIWASGGAVLDRPRLEGLSMAGGSVVSPEFCTLLVALVCYCAAFIAEVVRAGVLAVPRGQREAAGALGLTPLQTMRLVTLPQAMRLAIPPLTNQYLNLIKNSSLAVAVGYPDLVSISNTAINQTGRAVECFSILMAVYLALSLLTSWAMARFNQRMALRGR